MKDTNQLQETQFDLSETIKTKHRSRILKLSEFQKSLIAVDILEYLNLIN